MNGRSVPVTLDRARRLRYTFNALCELQGALGATLDELLAGGRIGFLELRGLLWAGLVEEYPKLTLKETGELIQAQIEATGSFVALFATALEALKLSGLVGREQPEAKREGAADAAPFASPASSPTPNELGFITSA